MKQRWAVTFGQRYNHDGEPHPVDERITGASFVVFEGTEEEARTRAFETLGGFWAFMYRYADEAGNLDVGFQQQIKQHGLVEVQLVVPPVFVPNLGMPTWKCPHCGTMDDFLLAEYGRFTSRVTFGRDGTIDNQESHDENVEQYWLTCRHCERELLMPEEAEVPDAHV